jgi:hypothetical protein
VILVGLAVGVLIIWSGHNSQGFQAKPPFSWEAFWKLFLAGSTLLWGVAFAAYSYYGVWGLYTKFRKVLVPIVEFVWIKLIGLPLLALGFAIGYAAFSTAQPSVEALASCGNSSKADSPV